MLKELYIENLAIIEKADIPFDGMLNVFSGETGAGKSILIGGINAILGNRTTKDIVRKGTKSAKISALFDNIPTNVAKRLDELGYEAEDELLLSREITADGKSTARISGRPATAAVLREIAIGLIDIHGQHDNQILLDTEKQCRILDDFGKLSETLSEYADVFREFSLLSRKIKKLKSDEEIRNSKVEILREKIKDIEQYKFEKGEEESVTAELNILRNNEAIKKSFLAAHYSFVGDETAAGAIDLIRRAAEELGTVSSIIPECGELKKRLDIINIDVSDISDDISRRCDENSVSEARLEYLNGRVSDILKLKRKYDLDIDELLESCEAWKEELELLTNSDDLIAELTLLRKEKGELLKEKGNQITEKRKKTAEILSTAISDELTYLDMPDVKLIIDVRPDKVTVNGMDSVEMLISVNKGEDPKPINKIASGGELSRIMLAIKSVLADNDDIPTMIFDEIDTGISGRAAQKVGVKLQQIAAKRQVICVTHLAQIASMADYHLLIEKKSDENRTYTTVKPLDFEERKAEIARIISGNGSAISIENARELLLKNKREN